MNPDNQPVFPSMTGMHDRLWRQTIGPFRRRKATQAHSDASMHFHLLHPLCMSQYNQLALRCWCVGKTSAPNDKRPSYHAVPTNMQSTFEIVSSRLQSFCETRSSSWTAAKPCER
jgi:hypothetical protein